MDFIQWLIHRVVQWESLIWIDSNDIFWITIYKTNCKFSNRALFFLPQAFIWNWVIFKTFLLSAPDLISCWCYLVLMQTQHFVRSYLLSWYIQDNFHSSNSTSTTKFHVKLITLILWFKSIFFSFYLFIFLLAVKLLSMALNSSYVKFHIKSPPAAKKAYSPLSCRYFNGKHLMDIKLHCLSMFFNRSLFDIAEELTAYNTGFTWKTWTKTLLNLLLIEQYLFTEQWWHHSFLQSITGTCTFSEALLQMPLYMWPECIPVEMNCSVEWHRVMSTPFSNRVGWWWEKKI